jgi:hypothetical protein
LGGQGILSGEKLAGAVNELVGLAQNNQNALIITRLDELIPGATVGSLAPAEIISIE